MELPRLLKSAVLALTAVQFLSLTTATAQSQTSSANRTNQPLLFVSGMLGPGNTAGGVYGDREKMNFALTVGAVRRHRTHVSNLLGIEFGRHKYHDRSGGLLAPSPPREYIPFAPELEYATLLGGIQLHENFATLTGWAGPGAFKLGDGAFPFRETTVFGVALRTDLWLQVINHVEIGGTASTRIMPAYRHKQMRANSVGVGIRLSI